MSAFMPDEEREAVFPRPRDTFRRSVPTAINFGTAEVAEMGGSSLQTGDGSYGADLATNAYDGIVATARTPSGSPIAYRRELRENDLVSIHGMDVTVGVARSLGLIAGDRVDAEALHEVVADDDPEGQGAAEGQAEVLSGNAEDTLGQLIAGTSPTDQIAGLAEIVDVGELSVSTLERAASQMGVEPDALAEKVTAIRNAFERQATDAATRAGVHDIEAFWEWAWGSREADLKAAMRQHGTERTTAGYQALASDFIASFDQVDPEAILTAEFDPGMSARRHQGRVLVTVDGREMTWSTAVRTGLIGAITRK